MPGSPLLRATEDVGEKPTALISCCSVAQLCLIFCDPMNYSMPGFLVLYYLLKFPQTHVHWVDGAIQHLIFCHSLLLLISIVRSTRVYSNESALHMRWLKYWSFSFIISPSNEYSTDFLLLQTQAPISVSFLTCSSLSLLPHCTENFLPVFITVSKPPILPPCLHCWKVAIHLLCRENEVIRWWFLWLSALLINFYS